MNRIGMVYEMRKETITSDISAKKATVEPIGIIAKRIQITLIKRSAFTGTPKFELTYSPYVIVSFRTGSVIFLLKQVYTYPGKKV